MKKKSFALAGVAQWVGVSLGTPKGWGFDFRSGHIPRLQVPSLVGACVEGNQSIFLSHINVSFSHPHLSLSLSKINKHIKKFFKKTVLVLYTIYLILDIDIKPISWKFQFFVIPAWNVFLLSHHCLQLSDILGRLHNFLAFTNAQIPDGEMWCWLGIFQYHSGYLPLLFIPHHLAAGFFTEQSALVASKVAHS